VLVFFINLLRIGFVLAILSHVDLQAAALAHNITYIIFTLIGGLRKLFMIGSFNFFKLKENLLYEVNRTLLGKPYEDLGL